MNDLATLTAQPRPFAAGGRTYQIHPLTVGDLGRLQAWIDAQYRNPIEAALEATAGLPMAQQKFVMAQAVEVAARPKPKIGTPEASDLIRSIEGTVELLYLGIAKGDPSFSRADIAALVDGMTPDQLAAACDATEAGAVLADPKAGGTAT